MKVCPKCGGGETYLCDIDGEVWFYCRTPWGSKHYRKYCDHKEKIHIKETPMKNFPFHCFECDTSHLLEQLESECPECHVKIHWHSPKKGDPLLPVERVITGRDPGDEQP